jgi:hypothetical protein
VFAVPAFGQVQRDVPAAGPGGAGSDIDQVAAQRGTAGLRIRKAGQGSGGAQQVAGDGSAGQPSGIGGKREPYSRLNDAVCVCTGEVRAPSDPGQTGPDLVIDVAELIWEPIAD